jgi:uncharacterized protein with von Willebrand factor type A (vWA) domain
LYNLAFKKKKNIALFLLKKPLWLKIVVTTFKKPQAFSAEKGTIFKTDYGHHPSVVFKNMRAFFL